MKKRILSLVLVLAMTISLIPSTLVTVLAADIPQTQAAGNTVYYKDSWPASLTSAVTDIHLTAAITPNNSLTVESGQTLIVHGNGAISGATIGYIFEVKSGGHLVLDGIDIKDNTQLGVWGAMIVKSGGLLDLGYNDRSERKAPSITNNTTREVKAQFGGNILVAAGSKRNLTIGETATVRLNAPAEKPIGITYGGTVYAPVSLIQGGRYTLQSSDLGAGKVTADDSSAYKLVLYNDQIVMQKAKQRILYWYVNRTFNRGDDGQDNSTSWVNLIAARQMDDVWKTIPNLDVVLVAPDSWNQYKGLDQYTKDEIMGFDMIEICAPRQSLNQSDVDKILAYLNRGGRVYIQTESGNWPNLNNGVQKVVKQLNGEFNIQTGIGQDNTHYTTIRTDNEVASKLMNGVSSWKLSFAGVIGTAGATGVTPLMTAPSYLIINNKYTTKLDDNAVFAVDQYAGDDGYGNQFGRITVMSDADAWVSNSAGPAINSMKAFAKNMLTDSMENRLKVATGENPNASKEYQATTTTTTATNYRTPYAAMQKAVEGNTVTLLTKSNAAVEQVSDELLFENATLTYEAGSQYDGSRIYADTAGVYVDITKTGEVNLRSGTVTVTPANEQYVLTLGGTGLNTDGSQIEGGIKITSATKYTLNAEDADSPILPENGGKASITIPNQGESVTVDYGNGKTVTYTAKQANDKVYLGWYQVNKTTPSNVTWQDADKAWYGHTFTTTLQPNAGYEVNGENLTVADTDVIGNYVLTKQGDTVTDPDNPSISWTTYQSAETDRDGKPKVTVKQQHLHSGGADRNGIAIVTVNDVHANITIGAANGTVNAKSPTIYVVGIGQRAGQNDVQLWEYTTVRNTKDGVMEKPVNGWPWEKWKVKSAASGDGTESDYKADNVTLTTDDTKLDTSSETAQYTVDLQTGDKVVVFYYDWNMVEVTIKATIDGNPIPDYTEQVVEYELNKQTTITAPNLIGYEPVTTTQDMTPTADDHEITFAYKRTTGNLIYKAVDQAGNELGTFSGGTLVKGQAPNKAYTAAPHFDNYMLAENVDGTVSSAGATDAFDGTNDITVTYTYKARTKNITVYMVQYDDTKDENKGASLGFDQTTYKAITTGQTITITAPEIAGYAVHDGQNSQTFFIKNDDSNQDVYFFYDKDDTNEAYVLVKLVDTENNKVISSYKASGVAGTPQLIKAPDAPYGYKADPAKTNEDTLVTPPLDKTPHVAEIEFHYVPNVHTVTVALKDSLNNTDLSVNYFVTRYQVVDGEDLTITAPSIYGYTMKAGAEAVKKLTNITADQTVTFEYEPIDQQLVTVHVKGVGPDGSTLFESRETVTHGTAAKDVAVFTLPGLKLTSAKVGSDEKIDDISNGKLTVATANAPKGSTIEVVLTYESNMIEVTVKAMYNGQELQHSTRSLEKGVQTTINAPSIPGYTAADANQTITPSDTDNTVTFTYTKDSGNVIVVVLENGVEQYRKDGGTVNRGNKIDLTGSAKAPAIEYFTTPSAPKSVTVNGTEVNDLTTYTYDGVGDIIVTYEYARKTQDVTIVKKNVDTGAEITQQTLQSLPVGQSHAFNAGTISIPNGYAEVSDRNPSSYFVEDKANQTVTFWYKNTSADQFVQVTVNLLCDGTVFQSYPVTAIKGVKTTILAPSWAGYELAAGEASSKEITPDGTANDKVEFSYTIKNAKTIKVILKDNANTVNPDATLNAPAGYTTSYTLKEGDSVEIWAPSIDGYTLMSATLGDKATQEKQFVKADYATLANGETVVTFRYFPVTQANFVTHTVKFMVGDHLLYSHEKMIAKGNGTQIPYSGDDVKYMVPGYTYDSITYEVNGVDAPTAADVTDTVNATIIYHFVEDAATVTIKKSGTSEQDTVLTGYRKGQTVQVVAPVVNGYALTGDLIQTVTLNSANTDVTFTYAAAGQVTFTLKELNADGTEGSIIAVINGEANKTYDANAKDGSNPLDLSKYGYTYTPSNLTSGPFMVGGTGKVENPDLSKKTNYVVYYTKNLRTVEYVPVDKAKLGDKTLDEVIANNTVDTYKITELTPATPEKARVGETYKAVAQSFNGWALKDDFSKLYQVESSTESLKVYFLYEQKTTGTVTVHYHFGEGADNKGKLINEYSITAVAGEKVQISALEYFNGNKYHLRNGQTNPYVLTVTDQAETVDFYYEANFVTVDVKTVVDGGTPAEHEKHEVTKALDTQSGSLTLYPPVKTGYTLVGITATGATLTNGAADKLPTEYANNALTLTNLTTDAAVTYYYKATKASEFQTVLTVEYKYNGYDLADAKQINVNTGEANTIDVPAFDGYTATTTSFKDGNGTAVSLGITDSKVTVTPNEKTATLTITYVRPDGSVVLPGAGDKIGDSDDIIVKPTDPNAPPTVNPGPTPAEGSVTIPDNTTGTVTRPKDPTNPDEGKEDIIVPGGSTIDKDGTIHLPDNGGEIGPDKKIPDDLPDGYIAITYDSNNGTLEVKKEVGKKGELQVKGSLFTHPTNARFEGWNDSGLGSGTSYAEGKNVDASIRLYAKWSADYTYKATITYKPNGGTPDKNEFRIVGHDTDSNLIATLIDSPYQVSGWNFGGWNEKANGSETLYQAGANLTLVNTDAKELYAQWYKVNADGSITIPGKDGNPNTADDNATANGDGKGNHPSRNDKGEIEIPKGGSVTQPDGTVIGMPDGGTLKPDGTIVINRPDKDGDGKGDGTITIPGKDGTNPDVTDKDGNEEQNKTVYTLTYTINNGENDPDVVVKVVDGDKVAAISNPFKWDGHTFINWLKQSDSTEVAAGAEFTVAGDETFHAQWIKQNTDGSVELPGKDGSLAADGDNVIVTPDNHPVGNLEKKDDGSVEVKGDGATVNRPTAPDHPENGREDVKVPEGSIIKPDGTIELPNNGGTINPDDKLPASTPSGYISVTYKANGGTGDDVIVLVKENETVNAIQNPFKGVGSAQFTGWNTAENGIGGTAYAVDANIPSNNGNVTLYAQWSSNPTYAHSAKITYQANDGATDAIEDTVGANDSTKFSINLRSNNTFVVNGWTFGGWNTEANGTGDLKAAGATVEVNENVDQTWYAQWFKTNADGSITVPGDGNPNTEGDNVTANGNGVSRDTDTGNITIPAGGNVVKGNGETIALPNGGTLKPDGSLSINKPNGGGTIDIDKDGTSTDPTNTVALTYQANNGTGKEVKVYAAKNEPTKALAADTFSYSGHRFLFWKSGNDTFKADGDITPTDAMTLSAVWAKVNPDGSIELPGEDGKLPSPDDQDNVIVKPDGNGSIDTVDDPKPGSAEVNDPDGGTVTRPDPDDTTGDTKEDIKVPNGTVVEPDGTIKLPDGTEVKPGDQFPEETTNYATVTFEAGDGTGNTIKQLVQKNSKINLLDGSVFTAQDNHYFVGWKDAHGKSYDANVEYTVTGAATFTAQYEERAELTKAVAIFDYAGGTDDAGNGAKHMTGRPGTTITNAPIPTRTGYTFAGWDNTLEYGEVGSVTVFTAQWTIEQYEVTFANDDTSGTMSGYTDPVEVEYGSSVAAGSIPTIAAASGKVFIGWKCSADNSVYTPESIKNYAVTADVTFEAQYENADEATVIFVYAGGTLNGAHSKVITGTEGTAIGTLPEPTRTGYTLNGWDVDIDENTQFGAPGSVTVYTAQWVKDQAQTFEVKFEIDPDKGSTADAVTEQVEAGGFVQNVPTITAEPGYKFVGWKDQNGKMFYDAGILLYPITEETTFAAQFEEITATTGAATVIFDANGGKIGGNSILTKVGTPGAVIGLPAEPTHTGFKFLGWSDGFDASTTYGAADSTVTYTAQWEALSYTIHFSATGASGTTADQIFKFDGSTSNTINRNGFAISGKSFLGWSLTNGSTTADYADGALIDATLRNALTANGSVTLYAVWKDNGGTSGGGGSSGGGGGGGSSTTGLTITASAGKGGSISPSGSVSVKRGSDKAFTISASNGYVISDVLVDGKSVGAVSSYVFSNVTGNHTISVTFKAAKPASSVADPDETGVSQWLRVTDHVAYMGGYDNGMFGPTDNLTRAQTAQMFYRLLLNQNVEITASFKDVPADAWYAKAVNTLASLGIVTGQGNGEFAPNRQITRAEFVVIATRFAKATDRIGSSFTDVADTAWYAPYVMTAVSYGWVNGTGDGRFAPNANITRAEAATIINRMLARSADRDFVDSNATVRQFPDVSPDAWYYYQVMEAANEHSHRYNADGYEVWNGLNK